MTYYNFGSRVLKLHRQGTDVKVLQHLLNNLSGIIETPLVIDGYFGPKTEGAVKKFQEHFGLKVDGIVGPITFLFFGQATKQFLPSGARQFGSRTLKKGRSGRDVWVLQNRLASTKMKYATALEIPADSKFGTKTQNAVKLFQKDHGLVVDGVVGSQTFYSLYLHTYMGGRYLRKGDWEKDKGYDVYFLQKNLKEMGYYKGVIDGKFETLTDEAVRELQKAVGIKVDGLVGPQTYFHLATV